MKNIMPTIPTATELAIKYAKREQLRIIIDKAWIFTPIVTTKRCQS